MTQKLANIDKDTDCWGCGQTFGEPIVIGEIFGHILYGKILCAHDEDSILCTDCMDKEIENQPLVRGKEE